MFRRFGILTLLIAFALSSLTLNANALEVQFASLNADSGLSADHSAGHLPGTQNSLPTPIDESEESEPGTPLTSLYEDRVEVASSTDDILFRNSLHSRITHRSPRLDVGVPTVDLFRPPEV
jgi:hypothetical protein